jgi:hypothetical protein
MTTTNRLKPNEKAITELQRIGTELYGDTWIGPMARDLGIIKKSIQDWVNGKNSSFNEQHWFWGKVSGLRKLAEARNELQGD